MIKSLNVIDALFSERYCISMVGQSTTQVVSFLGKGCDNIESSLSREI